MLLKIASSVILSSKISLVNKNKFKAAQRTKSSYYKSQTIFGSILPTSRDTFIVSFKIMYRDFSRLIHGSMNNTTGTGGGQV
jgi:hypothetical protein